MTTRSCGACSSRTEASTAFPRRGATRPQFTHSRGPAFPQRVHRTSTAPRLPKATSQQAMHSSSTALPRRFHRQRTRSSTAACATIHRRSTASAQAIHNAGSRGHPRAPANTRASTEPAQRALIIINDLRRAVENSGPTGGLVAEGPLHAVPDRLWAGRLPASQGPRGPLAGGRCRPARLHDRRFTSSRVARSTGRAARSLGRPARSFASMSAGKLRTRTVSPPDRLITTDRSMRPS